MQIVNVKQLEESFVIYFGSDGQRINAYTLASSLVNFADAVKSANAVINPGYDIEVLVESFGPGSFKVKIKALYKGAKNVFSKENLRTIVLSVVAAYVYEQFFSPETKVIVNTDEVIIEEGNKRIIVPREVHDSIAEIEKSEKFKQSVGQVFEAVERDTNISSFGFTTRMEGDEKPVLIPRESFPLLSSPPEITENQRIITENARLYIRRAILEKGTRKWEFAWRGVKIAAPILDEHFYKDFFCRKIAVAPGDSLEAVLKIYQVRDEDTGIYINQKYEVVEVRQHIPQPTNPEIGLTPPTANNLRDI